jgi:hypothetical protein
MAGWEQGLWFICTFLNLAAFGFWVVYMFEIIQVEVDAIKAQQEVRGVPGCVWCERGVNTGTGMVLLLFLFTWVGLGCSRCSRGLCWHCAGQQRSQVLQWGQVALATLLHSSSRMLACQLGDVRLM